MIIWWLFLTRLGSKTHSNLPQTKKATDDQLKSSSDWNSDQTIKSYATEVILHKTTS